ncbi:glycosyltransferase [Arthrobacter sp. PAMC25284]|uniref:glycosyltransferase n=1 Tax=Arthrobacter sp. PAMC25284 TaxID=2861279 RepID=UPI001C6328B3|nr:glycosyltransferase [Arthrobacter sp. PAMC25284]QYF89690.1 glycosyltransferase [Arthrobacter sp. PAMC25284]
MSHPTMPDDPDVPVSNVTAVVTAFRPAPDLIGNVQSLLRQVASVVVVDDGGGPGFDDVFAALAGAGATVVRLDANAGIAAALNAGIGRGPGRTAHPSTSSP